MSGDPDAAPNLASTLATELGMMAPAARDGRRGVKGGVTALDLNAFMHCK
ncbi:hypothetical protein PUR23_14370 [Methylorubrum populi]|jgi:hypothetical protein|uniref:Uncharacterized protein n=1 Tax=Methylobacterium brachiatum TaxID=269660 RepID=A0AAJ1WVR3_9HYPH|nr:MULTISPECIES: hypothetical protein [Methylobacterium]MCB4802810.1 hypothetical protein [Methylobacterium brachiatum]MDQ0543447.1 hypothetical protein [Methylobacterium brachiatum]